MRTAERAYSDADEQRYLFSRCMVPYQHLLATLRGQRLSILDAGSGAGAGAALLAQAGARVFAVDFSPEDVALTARTSPLVCAAVADVGHLPYRNDSFDVAMSCHVLEHLVDPQQYLHELRRVLRPRGQLWLITPNRLFSSPTGPPRNPFHVKEYFFDEFTALVQQVFPEAKFAGVAHQKDGTVAQAEAKRGALHNFDPLNLRRLVPGRAKQWVRALAGATYPSELRAVSVSDFDVTSHAPEACVDLMAIVHDEADR